MITRALEKYLRISPKKMRPITRLVSQKKVEEALYLLMNLKLKGAGILKKVLDSAINNAKRLPDKGYTEENLYISKISVNPGPALKRFRAMSMGRAGLIRKRTSHVLIELDLVKEKSVKKQKSEKPKKSTKAGKK